MFSAFVVFSLLPILVVNVNAGFQDAIAPRNPTIEAALLMARQDAAGCSVIQSALSSCESANSGFNNLALTDQASCLCYSSMAWDPNVFDGAAYTCAQYASSVLQSTLYSEMQSLEGICSSVGDIKNGGPASATAITTPIAQSATAASINTLTNPACSFVGYALSFCSSVSPGFATMDPTSQAPCLCYSKTSWSPDGFDIPISWCAKYISTAAPQSLTDIVDLEGLCSSVGDVLANTASIPSNTALVTETSAGSGIGVATGTTTTKTSKPGIAVATTTPLATTKTGDAPGLNNRARHWSCRILFNAFIAAILL